MAQDGDSEIVMRNLTSGAEWRAPRGYRPPAPPPDDSIPNVAELIAANARLVRPAFTADSRFLLFSIEPTKAEVNKAKKAGPATREGSGNNPAPKEGLKNGLGIMDTSTVQITRIERVKSFQGPEDGYGCIAYLLEPKSETVRGSTANDSSRGSSPAVREGAPSAEASPNSAPGTSPLPVNSGGGPAVGQRGSSPTVREGSSNSSRAKKKEYGSDLVLRNTTSGTERTFSDALDYTLSKDAKTLVFAVSSKKEETNGLYVLSTQSAGAPLALLAGKGKYQKLIWDEDQAELAFISDRDDADAKQPKSKGYLWNRNGNATVIEGGGSSPTVREGLDRNHTNSPTTNAT